MAWLGPGSLIRDVAVVCNGEEISYAGPASEAPEADEMLELDGFMMPAAADRHVHIGLSDPAAVLVGGVTAVRDLAWPADRIFSLADASEGPSFNGPLIRAAGPMLTAPGGYPVGESWAPPGTGLEVRSADEARSAVEELAGRGAGQIKVSLNSDAGPTPDDATLVAICTTAASRGIPVTAHAQGKGEVERALGAGVTELAHTPWTESLSDSLLDMMAKSMRIVSTLDILSFGRDTPEVRTALDNMRRFIAAGGAVFYGTDLGNGAVPPGIHVGELGLMRQAGLGAEPLMEALVRGPLAEGAPADLIGLTENPLEDLGAFESLVLVVRNGQVAWVRPEG
ncbi:MAG: amidohydrolase [Actinomycetota bacterium]